MSRLSQEVENIAELLRTAIEDDELNTRLRSIQGSPADQRSTKIHELISDILIAKGPKDFNVIHAISRLTDDKIAKGVFEAIYPEK